MAPGDLFLLANTSRPARLQPRSIVQTPAKNPCILYPEEYSSPSSHLFGGAEMKSAYNFGKNSLSALSVALLIVFFLPVPASAQRRARGGDEGGMRFRFVGPSIGNRVAAIAAIAGDPSTYYAGAASGGVWKSTDGGNRWDAHLRQRAGRCDRRARRRAFRPQRRLGRHGRGLGHSRYRRDGRRRLQVHRRRQDLDARGPRRNRPHRPHRRQSAQSRHRLRLRARPHDRPAAGARRLSHHPTAASTGHRALFVDENTGCSGLSMDPHNPQTSLRRHVAGRVCTPGENSAAAPAAASTSRTTAAPPGRASKATACRNRPSARSTSPSRPRIPSRVYALIQTADQGSLWRSDDGGENWRVVN